MRLRLAIVLLLSPCFALAEDWEGVTPWKFIAGDGSVTTSKCIGSNDTLDCLIDSVAACSAWSEMPQFRPDNIYYEAPVCFTSGNDIRYSGAFKTFGPVATELYIYRTENWTIDSPDGWHNPGVAQAGDVGVDFFSMTCSPNPGCLKDLSSLLPSDVILARCPRNFCVSDGPYEFDEKNDVEYYGLSPDEVQSIVFPGGTILTRQAPEGWVVVDWYNWAGVGSSNIPWIADHWKRK